MDWLPPPDCDMKGQEIRWLEANQVQPSQFYVNQAKVAALEKDFDWALCDPIPVKAMAGTWVMTDGHTRATCMILKGCRLLPAIDEIDDLDWEAYRINVRDCQSRGVMSALDLPACLVSAPVFDEKWPSYCDEVHARLRYLRDPCGASALAYWKERSYTKPPGLEVFSGESWQALPEGEKASFSRIDTFFKLCHDLSDLEDPVLPSGYLFRTFDPESEADFDQALAIVQRAYPSTDLSMARLRALMDTPVYRADLWFFIDSVEGDELKSMAFALGDLDPLIGEGILEWIQVDPDFRRKGLGKALVLEILRRMRGRASFATVSGDSHNANDPMSLYRKAGFVGQSLWVIAYR